MAEDLLVEATVAARKLDIALRIEEGTTMAIVGPNGAGKSSLIELIAGPLRPDRGTVVRGSTTLVSADSQVPPHRRRVGYLEQRPLLFPHLTVLDNVAYGPRSHGETRSAARERASRELVAVGLERLTHRRPGQLSGGEAQRVALARALAVDPLVMLLDEPLSALDAAVAPELRTLLRERLRDVTTVLVTHDFLDVAALADDVAELADGRLVAHGPVDQLSQRPTTGFLADFMGLNLLHGSLHEGVLHLGDGVSLVGTGTEDSPAGQARAVFTPGAVSLFRQVSHGSPRNELPVEILSIEDRRPVQRVALSLAGQRIHAEVTPDAVRDLALKPGDTVYAVLKATQIRIFSA